MDVTFAHNGPQTKLCDEFERRLALLNCNSDEYLPFSVDETRTYYNTPETKNHSKQFLSPAYSGPKKAKVCLSVDQAFKWEKQSMKNIPTYWTDSTSI